MALNVLQAIIIQFLHLSKYGFDMWSDIFELGSRDVHIIAINGIGMSAIARILINFGYSVNGSDISQSKSTIDIIKKGAKIHIGHNENNINTNAVVVISSIIKDCNPELEFAKKNKIKVFHRIDVLAKIAAIARKIIVFSGTHGKTTSTSLCAWVFEQYTDKFIAVSGGMMENYNSNVRIMNFNKFNDFHGFNKDLLCNGSLKNDSVRDDLSMDDLPVKNSITNKLADDLSHIKQVNYSAIAKDDEVFSEHDCDYAILEGDESDNSFIKLNHDVAIINNLNPEHLDYYKTFDVLKRSVKNFLCMSRKYSIICVDDENLMDILKEIASETSKNHNSKVIYYGKNELTYEKMQFLSELGKFVYYRYYDIRPSKKGMIFSISVQYEKHLKKHLEEKNCKQLAKQEKKHFKNIYLNLYGEHNIQNAMGVFIVANTFGMDEKRIRQGFATFLGTERRFSILSYGESNSEGNCENNGRDLAQSNDFGITVVDDYAHHPNEVKAVIESARIYQKSYERSHQRSPEASLENLDTTKTEHKTPNKDKKWSIEESSNSISNSNQCSKLIMIFQPHKYSRLNDNFDLFVNTLSSVDILFILQLYETSEKREDFNKNEVHLYEELKERLNLKLSSKLNDSLNLNNLHSNEKLSKESIDFINAKKCETNNRINGDRLMLCENFDQCDEKIFEFIKKGYIEKGDLVLFCGAGNITHFAHKFSKKITSQTYR